MTMVLVTRLQSKTAPVIQFPVRHAGRARPCEDCGRLISRSGFGTCTTCRITGCPAGHNHDTDDDGGRAA